MKRIAMTAAALAALGALIVSTNLSGAAEEKPTSRPLMKGELMNALCPTTGKPAMAKHFVTYADKDKGVHARIYFCCPNCEKDAKTEGADLKALYEKAFLDLPGGKKLAYGKTVADLENAVCPFTGEEVADDLNTLNYNAFTVRMCCPGCAEGVTKDPDKFLHNVNNDIDRVLAELKKK